MSNGTEEGVAFERRLAELLESEPDVQSCVPFHWAKWSAGGIIDGVIVTKANGTRWEIAIVQTRTSDGHELNVDLVGPADWGPLVDG